MKCSNKWRFAVAAAVIGCVALAAPSPGSAFDAEGAGAVVRAGLRSLNRVGEPDLSSGRDAEASARYNVDPLHYNERWTSMFGSELFLSESVSLFADYQYDQWAPSSPGGEKPFRAWENYRVTVGWTVTY